MFLVFFALILCAALAYTMRGSFAVGGTIALSGFDGVGVIIAFITFVFASAAFGIPFGASLLLSLIIHETGHVLAHKMLGHDQIRFRLIPLASHQTSSDTPLRTEGEVIFVALMGPALSLAPMAVALTLSMTLANSSPEVSGYLSVFAVTCGAYNFVNLLPIFPLDGGRCARIAAANFWPALAPGLTVFMSAAMAIGGLKHGSIALLVIAGIGLSSLLRKSNQLEEPLGHDKALIALAAYAFTLAAHFTSGWLLFQIYL